MILTKKQLQDKLNHFEQVASETVEKNRRYCFIAQKFLKDYSKFKSVFDRIDFSQSFKLITQNNSVYKEKWKINILFDSYSITLLQNNNQLYIYCIAEYKLK